MSTFVLMSKEEVRTPLCSNAINARTRMKYPYRSKLYDANGIVSTTVGRGEAFHANERVRDQVVRELLGVEHALHDVVKSAKVNLRDRKVRLQTTS